MFYTGIGSRETPPDVLDVMFHIAVRMAHLDHTLRSGGADGADTALEKGCTHGNGWCEIYLPWRKFNGRKSGIIGSGEMRAKAAVIAEQFHPAWPRLKQGVRAMHTRNVFQVLGRDLETPSDVVICWAPRGQGGTGQALRIAAHYDIPIINLAETPMSAAQVLEKIKC